MPDIRKQMIGEEVFINCDLITLVRFITLLLLFLLTIFGLGTVCFALFVLDLDLKAIILIFIIVFVIIIVLRILARLCLLFP
jgi:hypothetical protein